MEFFPQSSVKIAENRLGNMIARANSTEQANFLRGASDIFQITDKAILEAQCEQLANELGLIETRQICKMLRMIVNTLEKHI